VTNDIDALKFELADLKALEASPKFKTYVAKAAATDPKNRNDTQRDALQKAARIIQLEKMLSRF